MDIRPSYCHDGYARGGGGGGTPIDPYTSTRDRGQDS